MFSKSRENEAVTLIGDCDIRHTLSSQLKLFRLQMLESEMFEDLLVELNVMPCLGRGGEKQRKLRSESLGQARYRPRRRVASLTQNRWRVRGEVCLRKRPSNTWSTSFNDVVCT